MLPRNVMHVGNGAILPSVRVMAYWMYYPTSSLFHRVERSYSTGRQFSTTVDSNLLSVKEAERSTALPSEYESSTVARDVGNANVQTVHSSTDALVSLIREMHRQKPNGLGERRWVPCESALRRPRDSTKSTQVDDRGKAATTLPNSEATTIADAYVHHLTRLVHALTPGVLRTILLKGNASSSTDGLTSIPFHILHRRLITPRMHFRRPHNIRVREPSHTAATSSSIGGLSEEQGAAPAPRAFVVERSVTLRCQKTLKNLAYLVDVAPQSLLRDGEADTLVSLHTKLEKCLQHTAR